ncbi:hypothetical protein NIES4075_30110 [Tolypothrix sp. NIES-4075]|nr:hypothetical protein NIES4075_30110 [Tolypothrix sp. NIES-4075]
MYEVILYSDAQQFYAEADKALAKKKEEGKINHFFDV